MKAIAIIALAILFLPLFPVLIAIGIATVAFSAFGHVAGGSR